MRKQLITAGGREREREREGGRESEGERERDTERERERERARTVDWYCAECRWMRRRLYIPGKTTERGREGKKDIYVQGGAKENSPTRKTDRKMEQSLCCHGRSRSRDTFLFLHFRNLLYLVMRR